MAISDGLDSIVSGPFSLNENLDPPTPVLPPPCSLSSLPFKLRTDICEKVVGPDHVKDTSSLARLARTCRSLNDAATPILYGHIRDHRISGFGGGSFRINKRLLPVLYNNDALASLVQSLDLAPPPFYTTQYPDSPPTKVWTSTIDKILATTVSGEPTLHSPIPALALISTCPNLTTLRLTTCLLYTSPSPRD